MYSDPANTHTVKKYYYTRYFLDRDEFMVENASLLIAFYDGREKGGTISQ